MIIRIVGRRCFPARIISKTKSSTLQHLQQQRTVTVYSQGSPIHPEDVFRYTTGRFLVNEEYELAKRYVRFDIDALCKLVSSLPSIGSSIVKIDKKEGGYNKALLLKAENGKKVIGKIPCINIVPPQYGTASEVAVLKFVKANSPTPVSEVLAWSANASSNPVQSEYIILERIGGKQLTEVWENLQEPDRLQLIRNFAQLESKLAEIEFPAYGALYLRDHLPPRLKEPGRTIDVDERYCLGPVYHGSWPGGYGANPEDYEQYSGPWRTLFDLGRDLVNQGIWQIQHHKTAYPGRGPHFGTPEEHVNHLKTTIKLMRVLSASRTLQRHSQPALCHPDFHPGNIFVSRDDPTKISGVIDWQFTTVMPRFTQVRWPVFLNTPEGYQTDMETPEPPADFEEEEGRSRERVSKKQKRDQALMAKCYEAALVKSHLESYLALTEIDVAVRQLFVSCSYTYRDGIVPLRDYLVKIFQNWSQLDLRDQECPYYFSPEEIERHEKQFEEYRDWLKMRKYTLELLGSNDGGWVPPAVDFEEAQKKHRQLYEGFVKSRMKYMSEAEASKLWFFRERG